MGLPGLSPRRFFGIAREYVWPIVDEAYEREEDILFEEVQNRPTEDFGLDLCVDGQYDSPGYSAVRDIAKICLL